MVMAMEYLYKPVFMEKSGLHFIVIGYILGNVYPYVKVIKELPVYVNHQTCGFKW